MSEVNQFIQIDFHQLIFGLIVSVLVMRTLGLALDWIQSKLGLTTKWGRQKEQDHELLVTTTNELEVLKKKQEEDVKKSIANDEKIKEDLKTVSETIQQICLKLDEMQEKDDETEKARIKDRIAQSYRIHHETGQWTQMEKESFEDLIKSYESHGGKNSFVHSVCEPESMTWKIVN